MKKFCFIFLILKFCFFNIYGQECNKNNIFTNPEYPENPIHTEYENVFDWTESYYHSFFLNNYTNIPNPYITGQGGVSQLYLQDDYKPEDGWELIRYNKGYLNFWEDDDGNGLS